jgi:hypothetical protein
MTRRLLVVSLCDLLIAVCVFFLSAASFSGVFVYRSLGILIIVHSSPVAFSYCDRICLMVMPSKVIKIPACILSLADEATSFTSSS